MCVKNDIKRHIEHTVQSSVEGLHELISKLEKTVNCLVKENSSLRSTLNSIQSDIKQVKKQPCSPRRVILVDASTEYDPPQVVHTTTDHEPLSSVKEPTGGLEHSSPYFSVNDHADNTMRRNDDHPHVSPGHSETNENKSFSFPCISPP